MFKKFKNWIISLIIGTAIVAGGYGYLGGDKIEVLDTAKIQEKYNQSVKIKEKYNIQGTELTTKIKHIDDIKIKVGEVGEFKPNAEISKWDGEVKMKVKPKLNSKSKKKKLDFENNKIKYREDKKEYHLYEVKKGDETIGEATSTIDAYEFEIILLEKPESNIVELEIETSGLAFYYQPELTQEEKDEGAFRPKNVIGSYAVYHESKAGDYSKMDGKNYRTGKAFHIYRPKIIDSAGTEVWGKLNITDNLLTVEIPQEFLDKAIYPVIVDPTFGYSGAGGGSSQSIGDRITGSKFVGTAGTATSITAFLEDYSAMSWGSEYKYALYKDSDDGLLGVTNEGGRDNSEGEIQLDFASGLAIEAVDYYIVAWSSKYLSGICFFPGSKILTPKGTTNIEDIKVGDEVFSYNFEKRKKIITKVVGIESTLHSKYIINKIIEASPNQLIYVVGSGYVETSKLKIGDLLLRDDNKEVSITSIDIDSKKSISYDLSVSSFFHNYFVERFLVHNETNHWKLLKYDSTGGTGAYDSETYNSFPATWAQTSDGTRLYSIYCTYTASGGADRRIIIID